MILAETTRSKPAPRRPITSHPLFPVIVVLWSGALFGVASLAIRTEFIEHAVITAGIDGVVPMAAPPLGKTAHLLIALLATGLGCLVGLVAMRRFAKPRGQVTPSRRRAATVMPTQEELEDEPASPIALFGGARRNKADTILEDEAQAEPEAPARRRRFSMAREEAQPMPDIAPVPGAKIFKVADLDPDAFETEADTPRWVHTIDQSDAHAAVLPTTETSAREASLFDSYVRGVKPSEPAETVAEPGFELLEGDETSAQQDAPAQGPVASTIARNVQARAGTAAERIAAAPLDTLSHVELLERLALTIERRRSAAAAAAAAGTAQAAAEGPITAPRPEALAMPAALRPVQLDPLAPGSDAHDDGDTLPGYVPPRHIGASEIPLAAEDDADEVLSQGYSSLRNFSRPMIEPAPERTGMRFDTPDSRSGSAVTSAPVTTEHAPAPGPRLFDAPGFVIGDQQHAERELRDALATLQRMSGAA